MLSQSYAEDVTVIICTRNVEKTISFTLDSVLENNPKEIIVVDGNSSDKTLQICKKYPIKIMKDEGIGLGNARNVGLEKVKTTYVYYVGPDCIIPRDSIHKLVESLKQYQWVGIQPIVKIFNPTNYISKSLNFYRSAKFYPGKREIIGTPWLYKTDILKKFKFNEKMNYSDDTELCSRLLSKNLSIGIANIVTFEIGENNFKDLFNRWKMYGVSDHDFYHHKKSSWTFYKRIKSKLSPLKKDFIKILHSNKINFLVKTYILLFLFFITFTRYYGWFLASYKLNRSNDKKN